MKVKFSGKPSPLLILGRPGPWTKLKDHDSRDLEVLIVLVEVEHWTGEMELDTL